MSLVRGQKIGQWHRTKTYSSLVTGRFELRCDRHGRGWTAHVEIWGEEYTREPLTYAPIVAGATREDAEKAACDAARELAAELLAAVEETERTPPARLTMAGEIEAEMGRGVAAATDAAGKALFGPPPAPLTIADVMEAERALAAANVRPPYELRATAEPLANLLASIDGSRAVETPPDAEKPKVRHGETFMGRISHTLLIRVSDPPRNVFRVSGGTPVGEAVYGPGKGPPTFAR